jgi:hypothetical protein
MKTHVAVLLLLVAITPVWAAKKMTVQELKQALDSLNQAKKTDEQVATVLKEVELTEELTASAVTSLLPESPGPETNEQVYVLEARSAMLKPPPSDLPQLAPPDVAMQTALQEKAIGLLVNSNKQFPSMAASKANSRFGHVTFRKSGTNIGVGDVSIMTLTSRYAETVEIDQGVERISASGADPRLRRVTPMPEGGTAPSASLILHQAAADGNIHWLRWEIVNGVRTSVFSFSVNKDKSPYGVDYCCFPTLGHVGREDYKPFKKTVGVHGEFFVDPDFGTIVRFINQAEFNPTDFVHREDTRIDYGPVAVGGNNYVLPVRSITQTEVIASGDFNATDGPKMPRVFVVSGYYDYHLAGFAQTAQKEAR